MPEVEAPERSGFAVGAFGAEICLGQVPDVDGVGDECGLLAVVELVELELAVAAGVCAGAGEAAGGLVLTTCVLDPKAATWALLSNCIGILALCLLLQSEICRCLRFQTLSTVFDPQLLTVQKCFCH